MTTNIVIFRDIARLIELFIISKQVMTDKITQENCYDFHISKQSHISCNSYEQDDAGRLSAMDSW